MPPSPVVRSLHGLEREDREVGGFPDGLPPVSRAERLRGVFDERNAILIRQAAQFVKVAGEACEVDADYRPGSRSDERTNMDGIDVERVSLHVGEADARALVEERNVGRRAGQDRRNHFIAFFQSGEDIGEMQRIRSGADRHGRVRNAEKAAKRRFEFVDLRPLPNPAATQRFANRRDRRLRYFWIAQRNLRLHRSMKVAYDLLPFSSCGVRRRAGGQLRSAAKLLVASIYFRRSVVASAANFERLLMH